VLDRRSLYFQGDVVQSALPRHFVLCPFFGSATTAILRDRLPLRKAQFPLNEVTSNCARLACFFTFWFCFLACAWSISASAIAHVFTAQPAQCRGHALRGCGDVLRPDCSIHGRWFSWNEDSTGDLSIALPISPLASQEGIVGNWLHVAVNVKCP
jgi:hypothetical protein